MTIKLEKDFIDFIELCNQYELEYMVIGGYAVSIHGYPRTTKDLDICIKSSEENADKMISILKDFGFSTLNLVKEDFMKKNFFTQLGFAPVRIDIVNDLDAVPFDEAFTNRRVIDVMGLPVNFIGYNELLKVKEAAGRPQDLADVATLKKRNKK